jgi:hypothetical protein
VTGRLGSLGEVLPWEPVPGRLLGAGGIERILLLASLFEALHQVRALSFVLDRNRTERLRGTSMLDNPQYGNLRRVCRYGPPGQFLLVRLDPRLVLTAAGKERTKTLPGHMT